MKLLVCRAVLLLVCLCPFTLAHADNGARVVKYSQTDIIPIHAKVRFSTLIVLPADEEILDFTTGDKEFWIISGTHNLCYLHPAQVGIRSNLNLVTASGHLYSFLLTEISKQPGTDPDLKVFVTPNDGSGIAGNITPSKYVRASEVEAYKSELSNLRSQLDEQKRRALDQMTRQVAAYKQNYPTKLKFDYDLDKKARLAPFLVSEIYHDDSFTYIKSAASERPAIYEMKDRKPNLVNFDYENGVYIVPKILDSGYLVVGKKRATFNRQATAQARASE
jgi:type IV secretion system protein VirB9